MTDPLAFIAHVWLVLVIVPLAIGTLWGALVTLVGLHYLARAVAWWDSETPDALAAKAIVACWRVPHDQRRHFAKGLRAIWGEGPFRTVPVLLLSVLVLAGCDPVPLRHYVVRRGTEIVWKGAAWDVYRGPLRGGACCMTVYAAPDNKVAEVCGTDLSAVVE